MRERIVLVAEIAQKALTEVKGRTPDDTLEIQRVEKLLELIKDICTLL